MCEKASDNSDVSVASAPVSRSAVYQDDGIEEVKQKTARLWHSHNIHFSKTLRYRRSLAAQR